MITRLFLFLILFQLIPFTNLNSQTIKGKILDEVTGEPVAFANIVYSERAGTVTDIDGRFTIITNSVVSELRISCLGYMPKTLSKDSISANYIIYLLPLKYSLPEVEVAPGENPALAIMRQVVNKKESHNPDNYSPFSCIIYHKMTFDFSWPAEFTVDEINNIKDSLGVEKESYLFLFESVSEKKHWKKGVDKERIISGRVSGYKDPVLSSFPAVLQPFSFYSQYLELLGFSYLNPASNPGLSAYNFILEDTYVNGAEDTVYYISYRPKRSRNFRGLTGTFHIDGNSFAIRTVSAITTGTEKGLRLFIKQKYSPLSNGLWFPKQLESNLEFVSLGTARRLPFPVKGNGKSYVTAVNTRPGFSQKDFDNVIMEDVAIDADAPSVDVFRYSPLTARDSITYHVLDSIGRRNHLDAVLKTQMSLIKGYMPLGKFQLDLSKIIDYNDYEGLKLGVGLYTSPRLSGFFSTGGYYTYGFGDKNSKYGASLEFTPLKRKENKFSINYKNDVYATGSFSFIDGIKPRSSEMFGRFLTETIDLAETWSFGADFRFLKYFKSGLYYSFGDVIPVKPYLFMADESIMPEFTFHEAGIKLKWANKETFVHSPLGRTSQGTKWPVVSVNAGIGYWETESKMDYKHLEARVDKTFKYPNSMYSSVRIQGGRFYGQYANTFLYSALGSYKSLTVFVPYTFGTMRLNEFASDRFTAVYVYHGIPLALNTDNRIKPEIILNTNIGFSDAPEGINTFSKGYYESGIYFKNLFSNFFLQYGLSVHYRYGAYQLSRPIDNWAFKLGVEFAF